MSYYDIAAEHYYNGLNLISKLETPEYDRRRMLLLQNLGVVYEITFNYDVSIRCFRDALKIAQEIGVADDIEVLTFNIGEVYRRKNMLDEALTYFNEALAINLSTKNFYLRARIYNALGNLYLFDANYEFATEFYSKAYEASLNEEAAKNDRALYKNNLGESFFRQNEFKLATEHYFIALEICLNDNDRKKWILNNIGDVYYQQGQYREAIIYYDSSINIGKTGYMDIELSRAYKKAADIYDSIGNYKIASALKSKYIEEIKEDQRQQMSTLMLHELALQKERDDQKTALIQKEKETIIKSILLGISILILLASAWWGYRYYQKVRKVRRLVVEMENTYKDTLFLN